MQTIQSTKSFRIRYVLMFCRKVRSMTPKEFVNKSVIMGCGNAEAISMLDCAGERHNKVCILNTNLHLNWQEVSPQGISSHWSQDMRQIYTKGLVSYARDKRNQIWEFWRLQPWGQTLLTICLLQDYQGRSWEQLLLGHDFADLE